MRTTICLKCFMGKVMFRRNFSYNVFIFVCNEYLIWQQWSSHFYVYMKPEPKNYRSYYLNPTKYRGLKPRPENFGFGSLLMLLKSSPRGKISRGIFRPGAFFGISRPGAKFSGNSRPGAKFSGRPRPGAKFSGRPRPGAISATGHEIRGKIFGIFTPRCNNFWD